LVLTVIKENYHFSPKKGLKPFCKKTGLQKTLPDMIVRRKYGVPSCENIASTRKVIRAEN
jgi:hypothetical protein